MNETTAFLQYHKYEERTASSRIYGLRLCNYMHPQTPVTYKQDNCYTNTPMDKDKDLCQYAYKYNPVASITLPPKRPRHWYRTTTYTDNNRADMPTIYELDNCRTDMPAA